MKRDPGKCGICPCNVCAVFEKCGGLCESFCEAPGSIKRIFDCPARRLMKGASVDER